jgi:hypothetical protein
MGEDARGVEDRKFRIRLTDEQRNLSAGEGNGVAAVTRQIPNDTL